MPIIETKIILKPNMFNLKVPYCKIFFGLISIRIQYLYNEYIMRKFINLNFRVCQFL